MRCLFAAFLACLLVVADATAATNPPNMDCSSAKIIPRAPYFDLLSTARYVGLGNNIVQNGSFEVGINTGPSHTQINAPNASAITSWSVTAGSIDYIAGFWEAGNGLRSLDMRGQSEGTIVQNLSNVRAGYLYELNFLMSGNPAPNPPRRMRVTAGTSTNEFFFDVTGHGTNNMGWERMSMLFTATGEVMPITFESLPPLVGKDLDTAAGAALDDVIIPGNGIPPDPILPCVPGFSNAVWYIYTAPADGTLTIDTTNSTFDTGLAVYTGDCQRLELIACDDDSGGNGTSQVVLPVIAAETYIIVAGGKNGASGMLDFHVRLKTPVPAIFEVLPRTNGINTQVEILGQNFTPIITNNVVYFGSVQAHILAATRGQLTVEVPPSALFSPVTATVVDLTAYSPLPFTVIFPADGVFDADAFGTPVTFTTANGATALVMADVDNDGRADLVTANYDQDTISVHTNMSIGPGIGSASLAPRLDFAGTSGNGPIAITASDVDGDGRLDIIVANYSGSSISVFQNLTTPGQPITFAAPHDFSTGSNPRAVAAQDLDADGRPEIIVASEGANVVSVLRNLGNGNVGPGSFAHRINFVTGTKPVSVAIADFDHDGKPDIVTANSLNGTGGNSVTFLRNTSATNVINSSSFGPGVNVTTGLSPVAVAVGDVDNDGWLDVVTANAAGNSISVLRNTANGSLNAGTFPARQDFAAGSNTRQAALADLDGDSRVDVVVLNQSPGSFSVLRNLCTPGLVESNSFAPRSVYAATLNSTGEALGDLDRDGRPELVSVASGVLTVRRNLLKANPTVTWPPPAMIPYGTALGTNQLNASGSVPGGFSYLPPPGTYLNAGSNQTLTAVFFPNDIDHFNVVTSTVAISVERVTPLLVWTNPADIPFGTPLGGAQLNATARAGDLTVSGTFTYNPPAGTELPVGTQHLLTVNFSPATPSNLATPGPTSVVINVVKALPQIAWTNPVPVVYGTALSVTQLNAVALSFGQPVNGTFTYSPPAGTVLHAGSNQSLSVSFVPASPASYLTPPGTNVLLTVQRTPLLIRADDLARPFGETNPVLTATYTGLVNGDTPAVLDTPVTLATAAVTNSPVGSYLITATGAADVDYSITHSNGTLTVTAGDRPGLTLSTNLLAYLENDGTRLLDPAATVTDGASISFEDGRLTVFFASGGLAEDRLLPLSGGSGQSQVSVVNNTNIFVAGAKIGTCTGGTNGTSPLVFTLNLNATPMAVQSLVRQLAYLNVSENPAATPRLLEFQLTDGDGGTNLPVSLALTVTPVNDLPVAASQSVSLRENTATNLTLSAVDPDAASLTFVIVTPPAHGTLAGTPPAVTYTPALDYFGPDSFTFSASDGLTSSVPATVSFTINPVNNLPTLALLADLPLLEDAPLQTVSLTSISSGATNEAQTLTVNATSGNPALIPHPAVTYASPGTNGSLSFTPVANAFGSALITVTVNDGGTSNNLVTRTFTVTVSPVNDPPTLNVINNVAINEDTKSLAVNFSGVSSGAANETQVLTVTAVSDSPALLPDPVVSYTSPNANGALICSPVSNAFGAVTITVSVNDGGLSNNLASRSFTFTLRPVNDAPTVALLTPTNNASLKVPGPLLLSATALDVDGAVVRLEYFTNGVKLGEAGTNPPHALAWINVPVGVHSLTAVATDDTGATNLSPAITVTVNPAIVAGSLGTDNRFTLTFIGLPGAPYLIQSSSNLLHWSTLTSLTGTGSPQPFTDPTTASGARFYRWLQNP